MAYDHLVRSALHTHWHLRSTQVQELPSGWLSCAWSVAAAGERYVARLVDDTARRPLEAGLAVAEHLRGRRIAVGGPVRTLAGSLTATTPAGTLSVVYQIAGRLLDGANPLDQQWWGDRLGAAHRALDGFRHPGLRGWHSLQADAGHLAIEPWLRPAIAEAVAAVTRLTVTDRLTYGVLHGDPAPSAFVLDPATGRTGIVDWGAGGTGPLVYDLAAAVAYAGGPDRAADLVDGFAAAGPVPRDEIDAALPVLLRFRWAVLADWWARRLCAPEGPAGSADHGADRVALQQAHDVLATMTSSGS